MLDRNVKLHLHEFRIWCEDIAITPVLNAQNLRFGRLLLQPLPVMSIHQGGVIATVGGGLDRYVGGWALRSTSSKNKIRDSIQRLISQFQC